MEAKFFSYKVEGIAMQPINDQLKISNSFNKKELLNPLKDLLKEQGFKIDPATVEYKILENEILVTGMAVQEDEPRTIGFRMGN